MRSLGPFARNLEQPFRNADARSGKREPASVQGRERDFQSLAFASRSMFSRGTRARLVNLTIAVVERAQSHETGSDT